MQAQLKDFWDSWRGQLAESPSIAELRTRLFTTARKMSRALPRGSISCDQWAKLGVRVVESTELDVDGACMYRPNRPMVLVRAGNNAKRQKFTAAHEIAHMLLGRVRDAGHFALSSKQEERLCDEFATLLLLPAHEIRPFLNPDGGIASPIVVLEMAQHFGVNFQPCMIALNQIWADKRHLLLLAELRGHPKRPEEVDHRITASAGRPYKYVPPDQRLRSVGLEPVLAWASLPSQDEGAGICERLHVPFWTPDGPAKTGWLTGPSAWRAVSLKNGLLIILLNLESVAVSWSRSRTSEPLRPAHQ